MSGDILSSLKKDAIFISSTLSNGYSVFFLYSELRLQSARSTFLPLFGVSVDGV